MPNVIELSDQNFEDEVIKSKEAFLVDFFASWCQPCMMMKPIVEDVAKEVANKIKVGQLNVDDNPNTAEKFQILSIPTFILFDKGQAQKTAVGSMDKNKLLETFKKWLE